MVRLEEHKHATQDLPVERLSLPAKVCIPLSQHIGKICNPEVKAGDTVLTGQRIASAQANVYSPVHSSVSGKVLAIQDWPHPVLGRCKSVLIEGDGLDSKCQVSSVKCQAEIDNLTPEQIRQIIFDAGIVGMGGAGFPTQIKLNPPKQIEFLIINGAECEPYLTGDYRLMIEKTEELLKGIELVRRCLNVNKVYIGIEDNKPEAIEKFEILPHQILINPAGSRQAGRSSKFEVKILKSEYPQGGEKQLIKNILGKEVPSGKLPFDIDVVVHNVATIFAIYEAVYLNKPLYERLVTVTGSCISNPKNLLVRIGTPIKELIDFCGPLKEEPSKIIIGGPMMGIAQYTDQVPVIKTTNGVVLLNEKEAHIQEEEFCIRCGACIRACPTGLMPCLINLASQKQKWTQAQAYNVLDCIECGLCNYVCPAARKIAQSIKRAKLELTR